jgi:photosystem II stability/assembly factor-like uncharacterized protein
VFERIDEVRALSDDHFWLAADGRVFETRDRGATFVDKTPARDTTRDTLWSMFVSASDVYLLRNEEAEDPSMPLFVSKDGGSSFTERSAPRLFSGRNARLQRGPTPGSLLVLRSDGGGMNSHSTSIVETRDGGATFQTLGTVTGYGAITFQTATTWWTVGTCCASASSVHRSLDAGRTWKVVKEPNGTWEPRSDYVFLDASRGYRVVTNGIERTTDGGKTLSRSPLPEGADTVFVIDESACLLVGASGLKASLDMGLTWTSLPHAPLPTGHRENIIARTPHGWILTTSAWDGERHKQGLVFTLRDGATSWNGIASNAVTKGSR